MKKIESEDSIVYFLIKMYFFRAREPNILRRSGRGFLSSATAQVSYRSEKLIGDTILST